ncbi:glycosyltransferase family 2 protein [Sinomonas sp.]|uniref:glycosyltransferase family 2 protein n=1 Tax=Sinomonas sp. TaxID=1914986 RepID=UPI003F81B055
MRPVPLTGRPKVSVVIPCYNYGHFLPRAVQSVLEQPGVDVQIIVVDDASSDGSARIAEEISVAEPRVAAVVHEANAGHIATYNDGLSRCTGDYVVLLSADDLLAPGALARAAALFEARPGLALVYGRAPSFSEEPPRPVKRPVSWTIWSGPEWIERICRRGTNVIANPEAIVRREVVERLGGYDPRLPHTADLYFWLQAATFGRVGRIDGPPQAYYRIHGGNMHLGEDDLSDLVERSQMFELFLSSPQLAAMALSARTALAREALARATREYDLGRGHGPLAAKYLDFAHEQGVELDGLNGWSALQRRQTFAESVLAQKALSIVGRAHRRMSTTAELARIRRTGVA